MFWSALAGLVHLAFKHESVCAQWDALYPSVHAQIAAELDTVYASPNFKRTAYHALSGAVRIPSVLSAFPPLQLTPFAAQSPGTEAVRSTKIPFGTHLQIYMAIWSRLFHACQSLSVPPFPCLISPPGTTT